MKPASEWVITEAQSRALDAIVKHGCNKAAANALGLSVKTVEAHVVAVRANNGWWMKPRLLCFLEWDRYRRDGAHSGG